MLSEAVDDDCRLILGWRNHPEVRKQSFTTHEIGEEEHLRWWAAVMADPQREVLIYARDGVPCGVVTVDLRDPEAAVWGFYLDVDGLGTRALAAWIEIEREAIAHAFDVLGVRTLKGEVLATNLSVRKLHERYGFVETKEYDQMIDGVAQRVITVELAR